VRLGAGVDRSPDLRNPQLDSVVCEHGEGQSELVAIERALRLTDDHGFESTVGVRQGCEQSCGLGAALPR